MAASASSAGPTPQAAGSVRKEQWQTYQLPPLKPSLQHFELYETKSKFYLVGTDHAELKFKVLKIDRTQRTELVVEEDPAEYSRHEIHSMLTMIKEGNSSTGGLLKCISPYGIAGFVRFLEGFYIVLITKRKKVGNFGPHIIYSVESTDMIPIPHRSVAEALQRSEKAKADKGPLFGITRLFRKSEHAKFAEQVKMDEARYKSIFSKLEMTKNFYFSYTLDLTRTLQYSMVNAHQLDKCRSKSMYVWNDYLMSHFRTLVKDDRWVTPLIHGFFMQTKCSVYGRVLSLTLLARRSRFFAGTRYRKRGLNDKGHVANDVETEQIVADDNRYTSLVQVRGSIPLFWSQESSAIIPKPEIVVQRYDPLHLATRAHFEDLFRRYGSPVLAVNLVRQAPKNRESTIGGPFGDAVKFINQFLPPEHKIDYLAWDFKKVSKSTNASVVDKLGIIAQWGLRRTGLFNSHPSPQAIQVSPDDQDAPRQPSPELYDEVSHPPLPLSHKADLGIRADPDYGVKQCGVMRVNCIDSLDRTNVAQFCMGKEGLASQLYALRIIPTSRSTYIGSSKIVKILLDLYEAMGDALALQYGGSQMHRKMKDDHAPSIESAPVLLRNRKPTKGKEMFVGLVRHYQNSFQDNDKQDAMNLYLGLFTPPLAVMGRPAVHLWTLSSDFYLHNNVLRLHHKRDALGRLHYASSGWWKKPIRFFELENGIRRHRSKRSKRRALGDGGDDEDDDSVASSAFIASLARKSSATLFNMHRSARLSTASSLGGGHSQAVGSADATLAPSDEAFQVVYTPGQLTFFDEELEPGSVELPEPVTLSPQVLKAAKRPWVMVGVRLITGMASPRSTREQAAREQRIVPRGRTQRVKLDKKQHTPQRRSPELDDDEDMDDIEEKQFTAGDALGGVKVVHYKSIRGWFSADRFDPARVSDANPAQAPQARLEEARSSAMFATKPLSPPSRPLSATSAPALSLSATTSPVIGPRESPPLPTLTPSAVSASSKYFTHLVVSDRAKQLRSHLAASSPFVRVDKAQPTSREATVHVFVAKPGTSAEPQVAYCWGPPGSLDAVFEMPPLEPRTREPSMAVAATEISLQRRQSTQYDPKFIDMCHRGCAYGDLWAGVPVVRKSLQSQFKNYLKTSTSLAALLVQEGASARPGMPKLPSARAGQRALNRSASLYPYASTPPKPTLSASPAPSAAGITASPAAGRVNNKKRAPARKGRPNTRSIAALPQRARVPTSRLPTSVSFHNISASSEPTSAGPAPFQVTATTVKPGHDIREMARERLRMDALYLYIGTEKYFDAVLSSAAINNSGVTWDIAVSTWELSKPRRKGPLPPPGKPPSRAKGGGLLNAIVGAFPSLTASSSSPSSGPIGPVAQPNPEEIRRQLRSTSVAGAAASPTAMRRPVDHPTNKVSPFQHAHSPFAGHSRTQRSLMPGIRERSVGTELDQQSQQEEKERREIFLERDDLQPLVVSSMASSPQSAPLTLSYLHRPLSVILTNNDKEFFKTYVFYNTAPVAMSD